MPIQAQSPSPAPKNLVQPYTGIASGAGCPVPLSAAPAWPRSASIDRPSTLRYGREPRAHRPRVVPPGSCTRRVARPPHGLRGPMQRRPPTWRTLTAAHKACARPGANAARPGPSGPRPSRPVGPAHRSWKSSCIVLIAPTCSTHIPLQPHRVVAAGAQQSDRIEQMPAPLGLPRARRRDSVRPAGGPHQPVDGRQQFRGPNRLGQEIVHTRRQAAASRSSRRGTGPSRR